MRPSANPHDVLFRFVFGQPRHAAALLRSALPRALAAAIDWRTLARDDTALADKGLRLRHADLLFTARLRRTRALIYLLLEHKSTGDPFTMLQQLGYAVRVLERFRRDHPRSRRLPPVILYVLYHGRRPWRGPRRMHLLMDSTGLPAGSAGRAGGLQAEMVFVLDDLTAQSERRLRRRGLDALPCLALHFKKHLRYADDRQAEAAFRRWRRLFVKLAEAAGGRDDLDVLFSYLHETTDLDLERLRAVLAEIHPDTEHTYMTTADRIRRKAMKEGMAKGIAKGTAEGGVALLLRQLQTRFGPLPETIVARIRAANSADLDRYADLVLTARSLAEVIGA